jgi:hypothetical protein
MTLPIIRYSVAVAPSPRAPLIVPPTTATPSPEITTRNML